MNKKTVLGLLIVIILLVAMAIGLMIWMQNKKTENVKKEEIAPVVGWQKYAFTKTDELNKTPFILFYPGDSKIEQAIEFGTKPDKIVYKQANKECWMVILPSGFGFEDENIKLSSNNISLGSLNWDESIYSLNNEVLFHQFAITKGEDRYSFSVNPENNTECIKSYKDILSTFEFVK